MACGPGEYCSSCYYSCTQSCNNCQNGCDGGCKESCTGGCKGGCGGCGNTCRNTCTNTCTGTCRGTCTSCDGCSGSCTGKCNSGCSSSSYAKAYEALKLGLNDYITEQDLQNIYLIFESIKNRRADAGRSTSFTTLTFTKDSQTITADTISQLAQNAANTGFSISDNTIIQHEKFLKTTAEKLRTKAIEGYPTHYGR